MKSDFEKYFSSLFTLQDDTNPITTATKTSTIQEEEEEEEEKTCGCVSVKKIICKETVVSIIPITIHININIYCIFIYFSCKRTRLHARTHTYIYIIYHIIYLIVDRTNYYSFHPNRPALIL